MNLFVFVEDECTYYLCLILGYEPFCRERYILFT